MGDSAGPAAALPRLKKLEKPPPFAPKKPDLRSARRHLYASGFLPVLLSVCFHALCLHLGGTMAVSTWAAGTRASLYQRNAAHI